MSAPAFPRHHPAPQAAPIDIPVDQRLALPPWNPVAVEPAGERLFSFVVSEMPAREALRHFARAYELNIVVDEDGDSQLLGDPFEAGR